jgi:hypothetical protein
VRVDCYVKAGNQLAPVQTVVAAAVGLAEADHHQPIVVGQHVLLRAQAHRIAALPFKGVITGLKLKHIIYNFNVCQRLSSGGVTFYIVISVFRIRVSNFLSYPGSGSVFELWIHSLLFLHNFFSPCLEDKSM